MLTPVPDDEAFPASVRGADALFVLGIATGSLEDGAAALAPIARLGDGAVVDLGGPTSYADFQQFFDADYPAHTMRYYWKSSFADELTDERIDALVEAFARRPSHHSTIDIWPLGGAIARVSARRERIRRPRRRVADQPGVQLGGSGRGRGEHRLGSRDRRGGRRERLPELPGPARGG